MAGRVIYARETLQRHIVQRKKADCLLIYKIKLLVPLVLIYSVLRVAFAVGGVDYCFSVGVGLTQ